MYLGLSLIAIFHMSFLNVKTSSFHKQMQGEKIQGTKKMVLFWWNFTDVNLMEAKSSNYLHALLLHWENWICCLSSCISGRQIPPLDPHENGNNGAIKLGKQTSQTGRRCCWPNLIFWDLLEKQHRLLFHWERTSWSRWCGSLSWKQ